jgi:hypothetical protein
MLVPVVAGWLAWPATLLLTYILDVVTLFSRVPHAFVEGVVISGAQMALMYATMSVVFIILRNRSLKAANLQP